jgi:predicted O-methyltransferase YrrM
MTTPALDLIRKLCADDGLPGWCTYDKGRRLMELVRDRKAKLCVELGVFGARSLCAMALGLRDQGFGQAHGIDPFTKAAALEGDNDKANDDWWGKLDYEDILRRARQGIEQSGLSAFVQLKRVTSHVAVADYADGSIDVLHQDSNHSEAVSVQEVKSWMPKLAAEGLWVFDDVNWPTTAAAQALLESSGFKRIEDHREKDAAWAVFQRATVSATASAPDTAASARPTVTSPARLTIAYMTFRERPSFEWFARSLARELRSMPDIDPATVQILVIDGRLWASGEARRQELRAAAAGLIQFEHHPPKPTMWQGPSRLTRSDFFAAANTRNTALALARGAHVAFVDDLSVLVPGWLKAHIHAADNRYVLAGTTCKHKNILVDESGTIVTYRSFPPGMDSRWGKVDDAVSPCPGAWLYGGTFSVPLDLALKVNGQDEIYDPIGGEDYDFGIRMERAGAVLRISRSGGTFEDEDGHHNQGVMLRQDKPWAGPDGPYVSNMLYHRLMREASRIDPLGNSFQLSELRARALTGQSFPEAPTSANYWSDGQPLAEMG